MTNKIVAISSLLRVASRLLFAGKGWAVDVSIPFPKGSSVHTLEHPIGKLTGRWHCKEHNVGNELETYGYMFKSEEAAEEFKARVVTLRPQFKGLKVKVTSW